MKKPDIYCDQLTMIFLTTNKKIRFNELYRRKLTQFNAEMSKPTLVEHLNHLLENKIILRYEENKQKVSYELNWKMFGQLAKTEEANKTLLHQIKNKKIFKSKSLEEQKIYAAGILHIMLLRGLKLDILDILEPKNKLKNHVSFNILTTLYGIYPKWFIDTCKESKENSQKALNSLNKDIKQLMETFFQPTT
jgi:DNA-binding HxlR family transcriptional regulator